MKRKLKLFYALSLALLLGCLCACGTVVDDVVDDVNRQTEFATGKTVDENLQDILGGALLEDEHVTGVKNGTNTAYPGVTYGEAFENFFADPSWKYFVGTKEGPDDDEDGEPDYTIEDVDVVEFTGRCLYADVEVTALIQFTLNMEDGTFEPSYLSFNDVPQTMLMLVGMMDTVFTQAVEDLGASDPAAPAAPYDDGISEGSEEAPSTDGDAAGSAPDDAEQELPPVTDNFSGEWADSTQTFWLEISEENGAYLIDAGQNLSETEFRQWSLEEDSVEGNGIFYSGGYVDLYLRDDGTVGTGAAYTEAFGLVFLDDEDVLHWVSDSGELADAVLLYRQ